METFRQADFETSVKKQFDLTGRRVVITGGGGFLGTYFAEGVAEMGAIPLLIDIDEGAVKKALGGLSEKGFVADGFIADIADAERIRKVVGQIVATHERIDVLVNGAALAMKDMQGGQNFFAPFEEYDPSLWQLSMDVNLTGTFLVTQAVGKIMKEQKKGAVINVASDVAIISPDHRMYQPDERTGYQGVPFNTPIGYSVAKAGILAFTRYLATYWAKDGIRVNAISPAGTYRDQDPGFVEQLAYRIPLGRMASPQEFKGAIVYLASEASSFVTGCNLVIDGGRTIW